MPARSDDVAEAGQRNAAHVDERRRELTRELHESRAPHALEPLRRVPAATRELSGAPHATETRAQHTSVAGGIVGGVDQLVQAAAACRAQVIALASRLAVLSPLRRELTQIRAQLLASSARLDHAVEHAVAGVAVLTSLPQRPASLRP